MPNTSAAALAWSRPTAHVILIGDSVFDNSAYVDGGPDVVRQDAPSTSRIPDPRLQRLGVTALKLFNDLIVREAFVRRRAANRS
jgi:hypothetical protein